MSSCVYSCRPAEEPFLYGLVLPWALLHLLLWLGLILLPCPCCSSTLKEHVKRSWLREYIGLVLALFLFDVGWGLGLPATHPLHVGSLRLYSQIVFSVSNGLIGPVVLLFYCILNKSVRKMCAWPTEKLKRRNLSKEDWQVQSGLYEKPDEAKDDVKVTDAANAEEKEPPQITFEYDLDEVYGNPTVTTPEEMFAIVAETDFK